MSLKFTILGCGSSLGIPRIDGYFGKCNPKNKKNLRTRCSALISTNNMNILIDTSPDIKYQLLKNTVKNISKVFFIAFLSCGTNVRSLLEYADLLQIFK